VNAVPQAEVAEPTETSSFIPVYMNWNLVPFKNVVNRCDPRGLKSFELWALGWPLGLFLPTFSLLRAFGPLGAFELFHIIQEFYETVFQFQLGTAAGLAVAGGGASLSLASLALLPKRPSRRFTKKSEA
jgi:hypothetical protein